MPSEVYCPWGGRDAPGFPALEKLTLDFTEWQLTENEGLLVGYPLPIWIIRATNTACKVKPFVKKLGESGGLQELTLKGVKHLDTIKQFREGLVKEGGTFKVED